MTGCWGQQGKAQSGHRNSAAFPEHLLCTRNWRGWLAMLSGITSALLLISQNPVLKSLPLGSFLAPFPSNSGTLPCTSRLLFRDHIFLHLPRASVSLNTRGSYTHNCLVSSSFLSRVIFYSLKFLGKTVHLAGAYITVESQKISPHFTQERESKPGSDWGLSRRCPGGRKQPGGPRRAQLCFQGTGEKGAARDSPR